ncbi:MAG: Gfo/Idh/MocA family oxidoreductase [Candidatus Hydrogenedentes bacterium]|nr:Gfo/Idh/MocA family oxidoreductase [Candidatus Hydrogenedentota bacterium]
MTEVGFGIIGCGNIGPIHAMAIAEVDQARLVAVSDVVEENARKLAGKYGATPYGNYEEMLARDDVNVVCLCVPSGLRAEIAEKCAAAGKHILSEKPLEISTERIDRILAAVDRAGVRLGCVFQSRFANGPQLVRQALDEGRFGRVVLGDAYIKWYRSPAYYASGAWRGTRRLDGGGALMNQGIHMIDLLVWFLGRPVSVFAKTSLVGHEELEVEDLACAIITFESGAMGVIEGSTAAWPGHPARVEVYGTEGSAVIETGEVRSWQFRDDRPDDEEIRRGLGREADLGSGAGDPLSDLKHEGHRRQIEDFACAILEGREPAIDGREGRRSVELIEAIYRSAEAGRPVDI